MRARVRPGWWLALALAACKPGPDSTPPDGSEHRDAASSDGGSDSNPGASNRQVGEQLPLSLPLHDGGVFRLGEHQRSAVLLEVGASWSEGWEPVRAFTDQLARRYGDKLTVIVVADEAGIRELDAAMDPLFVLALDPQGAVATSLNVTRIPTLFVIAPSGEIRSIHAGFDADVTAAIETQIAELVGSSD